MPFQNAGGVAAAMAVYLRDIPLHRGTTEAISQKRIKRIYRKRPTACCNATDVRVSGTWPPTVGTYRAAFAAANRTALNFVQDRATTLYAATAPGPTTPVDPFLCRGSSHLSHCSSLINLSPISITSIMIKINEQSNIIHVIDCIKKVYS